MTITRLVAECRRWSEGGLIQAARYSGHHHSKPPNGKRRPQLPHSRSLLCMAGRWPLSIPLKTQWSLLKIAVACFDFVLVPRNLRVTIRPSLF
jgi:hypothetical protein